MDYASSISPASSDFIGQSVSQRSSPKSVLYSDNLKPPDLMSTATFIGNVPVMFGPIIKPEVEHDPSKMLSTSYSSSGLGSSMSRSRSYSPLKLLPDTSLHRYSSQDEDSGISNSFNASSRWRSSNNLSTSFSSPPKPNYSTLDPSFTIPSRSHEFSSSKSHDFTSKLNDLPTRSHELSSSSLRKNGFSKSVTSYDVDRFSPSKPTSIISSAYSSIDCGKSKSSNVYDVQSQLNESEQRRSLLVEKLTDARNTIKLQSDRLDQAESGYRNSSYTVEDYRQRERDSIHNSLYPQTRSHPRLNSKEYKKKIDALEQDKNGYQMRRLEGIKQREDLQDRIGGLENEIGLLRTSYTLMETEGKRHSDLLQEKEETINAVEDENLKLMKNKDSLGKEVSAMKESLDIARNRNDWLENQVQDNKSELISLRKENHTMSSENRNFHSQVCELRESNCVFKEENTTNTSALKQIQQDKMRLQRQVDTFNDSVADLKAKLAFTTSDKERFFQEKLDLHQRLQNATLDRETAITQKCALEEQLNEMNAELAQAKLSTDKKKEEWHKLEDECAAVKKVSEVLSLELASTKANLEKTLERNQSLEQTKKLAFQQHTLYEQEIKSLENQLKNIRMSMECIEDSHKKEKSEIDGSTIKLREELRLVKAERNQLELRLRELDAKKRQSLESQKLESEMYKNELETWKNSCEKMTGSLNRKEMEVQQLSKKLHDLEEQTGYMKINEQSFQTQYGELLDVKEQNERLENENRRLQQQRSENQQVIELLEMQKNILAKTSESSLNKSHDMSHDTTITQLQCQLKMLTSENQAFQSKVEQLEEIRDELIREKEERLANGDLYFTSKKMPGSQTGDSAISSTSNKQLHELEKQNKQLRDVNTMVTEQLSRVERQNADLRSKDVDTSKKQNHRKIELEKQTLEEENQHLKTQNQHLEDLYQKHREEMSTMRIGTPNPVRVQQENDTLQEQVRSLENSMRSEQNDKRQLDEETKSLRKQLADVNKQLFECSKDQTKQMLGLQKEVGLLQSELEDSKDVQNKQDNLILSLKDELEDLKTKKPNRIEQSLDDVGSDLNVMRRELQKLMAVIKTKDQKIESLGTELKTTKKKVSDSREQERDEFQDKLSALEKENLDLQEELKALKEELCQCQAEVERLQKYLKQTQSAREEDAQKAADQLRKELTAKDRQIESLEEQLRRNTSAELRRLKREASKVDILKHENRRLTNEMAQVKGASTLKNGSTTEDHDSWDSDSIHQDTTVPQHRKSLADELKQAEHEALQELHEDEDVRNVVALLGNVDLNDTYPLSTYNYDGRNQDETSEADTPRNESPVGDSDCYETLKELDENGRSRSRSPKSHVNVKKSSGRNDLDDYSKSGSDQSDNGRKSNKKENRFRKQDDEGAFPSPKLSDTPKRSSSTNYRLTSADNNNRQKSRSRSPSYSPERTYERSRSYERSPRIDGSTYESRSRSYDRQGVPDRSMSHDVTTGYGSLSSAIGLRNSLGNGDLNIKSLPESGQRYRSSLTELGPSPGETKEERRKRMRELLRTLDKSSPRY